MKSFAFAGIIAAANAISEIELKYASYLAQFSKVINSVDEFAMRMDNFAIMDEFIEEHNAGNSTYVAGHNQFSDWTSAERKQRNGAIPDLDLSSRAVATFDEANAAISVNWVTSGAVNSIKNQ